jgi:hypothetical protein
MPVKVETVKELHDSLQETMRALALVTFLSMRNHPDPEAVADLQAVLDRARAALLLPINDEARP